MLWYETPEVFAAPYQVSFIIIITLDFKIQAAAISVHNSIHKWHFMLALLFIHLFRVFGFRGGVRIHL